jgi:hypothetical protein
MKQCYGSINHKGYDKFTEPLLDAVVEVNCLRICVVSRKSYIAIAAELTLPWIKVEITRQGEQK